MESESEPIEVEGQLAMQIRWRDWWRFSLVTYYGSPNVSLGLMVYLWPVLCLCVHVCGYRIDLVFNRKEASDDATHS